MTGQTVSHYRVLQRLGGGGMGEVYEAEDLKLGRHVALKFLTPTQTDVRLALRRFEREARAASALNHPHICTIHDFGEHDGRAFLVMELLDGETLRARLATGRFDLDRVIELGIQVTDALDAAHRAGIVHRDITPSNIFITSRGNAKILDFGLAKLMPRHAAAPPVDTDGATVTSDDIITSPGAAMGTVAYMSPEQARGENLDQHTDIFSFGAVLYEMATGQRPFAGRTTALVFDAILHRMPPPPVTVNPALPPEFSQIVEKALDKDPRLRYQSAGDMRVDLERLNRREELRKVVQPEPPQPAPVPPRRHVVSTQAIALAALGAAALGVALFFWLREPPPPTLTPYPVTTAPGWEAEPAIAPEGDVIAYVSNEKGETPNIFLVQTEGNAPPQPLVVTEGPKHHPTWFPDGQTLAFVWETTPGQRSIYTVPRSGGEPKPLIDDAEDPAISRNGEWMAFVRMDESAHRRVFMAPVANPSRVVKLTTGSEDGAWDHRDPAWSPDGEEICYRAHRGLWVIEATPGARARLVTDVAARDLNPFWSRDGRFIYFGSTRDKVPGLWRVRAAGGGLRLVRPSTAPEQQWSLDHSGRILAFSTLKYNPDLVLADLTTGSLVPIPDERGDMCPVFGPDSRIYFVSNRPGSSGLWVLSPPASPEQPAVELPLARRHVNVSHPAVSPDGKWLAYYAEDKGNTRDIWIVSASGGTPTRFTTHPADDYHPAWSPDGKRIAFASERTDGLHIWVGGVSGDGKPVGEPRRVTSGSSVSADNAPAWSPNGLQIAYITQAAAGGGRFEVRIASTDGKGTPINLAGTVGAGRVHWNAAWLLVSGQFDEQMVTLRAFDPTSLNPRAGLPRIEFGDNDDLVDFDVYRDGRSLVFSKDQPRRGDIMVYRAQRPF